MSPQEKIEKLKAGAIFTVGKDLNHNRVIPPNNEENGDSYHVHTRYSWLKTDGSLYLSNSEEYGYMIYKFEKHSLKCWRILGGAKFTSRIPMSDIKLIEPEFEYLKF